jgi:phage recombination protein Bet
MNNALVKTAEPRAVEYIPFGAADKVKLTVQIVTDLCCVPTKSGKICDPRQAVRFMALCQAQRLNPFAGDAYLIGYDTQHGPQFSLITAHQAFLKRAESNEDFDGMESGIIVRSRETQQVSDIEGDFFLEDEVELLGGWAIVHHKSHKIPTKRRLSLKRFRKPFGVWQDDPAGMICKCAEADALRSTFPTLCGGLHLSAEVIELEPETLTQKGARLVSTTGPTITEPVEGAWPPPPNAPEPDADKPVRKTGGVPDAAVGKSPKLQDELADLVLAAGFTFTEFQSWAREEFPAVDAGSWSSFADLTIPHTKLFLRGRNGMLSGLTVQRDQANPGT